MPSNKNTDIGPSGGLCSYTYTGPPLTIGDPVCPLCGRYLTKMVFVCDCDKDNVGVLKENNIWNELKEWIEKVYPVTVVLKGLLLDKIENLEKKNRGK